MIPALGRLRQKDYHIFQANVDCKGLKGTRFLLKLPQAGMKRETWAEMSLRKKLLHQSARGLAAALHGSPELDKAALFGSQPFF